MRLLNRGKDGTLDAETREKINKIEFQGLSKLKIGDAMWFAIRCDFHLNKRDLMSSAIDTISSFSFNVDERGTSNVAFFWEKDNSRKDHIAWFEKIVNQVDGYVYVCSDGTKKEKNDYSSLIEKYYSEAKQYSEQWRKQIKHIKELGYDRINYFVYTLQWHYVEYCVVRDILDRYDIHSFACMCDAHATSSLLTQYYNLKGVRTITFTHAFFTEGWYYNCCSKYMLLYGKSMYNQAIGYTNQSHDKFVICGNPRFIGCKLPNEIILRNTNRWGIVLDAGINHSVNSRLISIVLELAKENNVKVICKKHPSDKDVALAEEYSKDIEEIYCSETTVEEFQNMVDVAFFVTSTVYSEFVMQLIPSFRLKVEKDNYSDIDWCCFGSVSELRDLLSQYHDNHSLLEKKMMESREILSNCDDISGRYKRFIENVNT